MEVDMPICLRIVMVPMALLLLAGCFPTEITAKKPDGQTFKALFYPGGSVLKDLVIIEGVNYFGKAQYQIDDPLADIGFRFDSGERVVAECTSEGKDIIGEPECQTYEVYRSDFDLIPEGSTSGRPAMF
jgi:hypothetical protein